MLYARSIAEGFLSRYQEEVEEAIKPLLTDATVRGTIDDPYINLPNLREGQMFGIALASHECDHSSKYDKFKEKMDDYIEANKPGQPISPVLISKGAKPYKKPQKKK